MLTTYKFRLYPTNDQAIRFEEDQRNACFVKNRMIGDRGWTYHQQHIMGDYCRIYDRKVVNASALRLDALTGEFGSGLYCSINRGASLGKPFKTGNPKLARPSKKAPKLGKDGKPVPPKPPNIKNSVGDMQVTGLPQLKKEKPFLQATSATVLQNAVRQVDVAFSRFFSGKSKYPTFKNARDIGLHYPDGEVQLDLEKSMVKLPLVGWVKFKNTREFWDGMKFSKFQVTRDVDQWFISIVVKDEKMPDPTIIKPEEVETVVGGDKGINKLLSVSGKTQFENPRFDQSESRRMQIRQRRVNRKEKGSNNRKKAAVRVAKLHRKIRRRRDDYQWKVAKAFVAMADCIAVEDLNLKGMMKRCQPKKDEAGKFTKNGQSAKSGLSKSLADAALYNLDQKIEQQAAKAGKLFIAVDPRHTSQECPKCHHVAKENRDKEKFICTECGHVDDADNNAGTNIANKAIEVLGLNKSKVRLVRSELTPKINVRRYQRHGSGPGKLSYRYATLLVESRKLQRKYWRSLKLKDSQPVASAQAG